MKEFKTYSQEFQVMDSIKELMKTIDFGELVRSGFFKNSLMYPSSADYDVMKICPHCGSKYKDENAKTEYNKARKAWHEEEGRLYNLFKEGLFYTFEIEHNEKAEKAFSIAWDRGHANGYYEVYQEFQDLAELLK
jgi:hypothetical protein